MAKTKVDDWSASADSNTDIDGYDIGQGSPAKYLNNAVQAVMGQVRRTPLRESAADMRTALSVQSTAESAAAYQPISANLSEYAAVNPTAAGLALLDDANADTQLVTLGGTSTGISVFKAADATVIQDIVGAETVISKQVVRVAPSAFSGSALIEAYIAKVRDVPSPGNAQHTIDVARDFEQLYGSDLGTEDVYWDPTNSTGNASDSVVAGRGQAKLPYLTFAAAEAHTSRRVMYCMGSGAKAVFLAYGANQLTGDGLRARPLIMRPFADHGHFTLAATGETARQLADQGTPWTADGTYTNLYDVTPGSSQLAGSIQIMIDGVWTNIPYRQAAYAADDTNDRILVSTKEYGWFQSATTKKISVAWGGLNIQKLAKKGRVRVIWRSGSEITFSGIPVLLQRMRFLGTKCKAQHQSITISGTPTPTRTKLFTQDCISEESDGFGFLSYGALTVHQRALVYRSAYDGFNYNADTVLATNERAEGIEIDCVVRRTGVTESRALELNSLSTGSSLRNLQASSFHTGSDGLRINCDYSATTGQVIADTGAEQSIANIACRFGHPNMEKITNPAATNSPFRNERASAYDTEFISAHVFGNAWFDTCDVGGPSSSYGLYAESGAAVRHFDSRFDGKTAATSGSGTLTTFNPASPG